MFTNPQCPPIGNVNIGPRGGEGAVAVDANGHEYFSDETPLEVMFPSYDQIVQDGTVILKNAVDTNRLSHTQARRHRD